MEAPARTPRIRPPAVAGSFYPREAPSVRLAIENSFLDDRGPGSLPRTDGARKRDRPIVAGIVPHAGYIYSGPVAAHLFHKLGESAQPKTVVILGVNHHGIGSTFSVSDEDWRTPLGVVPTDRELMKALGRPPLEINGPAHRLEHSIEVELPFLQYIWPKGLSIVAIQVTFTELSLLKEAGRTIARALEGKDALLLASTDLSHYLPPEEGRKWDDMAIDSLLTLSPEKLYSTVVENDISMCGIAPVTVLLSALEGTGRRVKLLAKGSSGDAEPMDRVVGYASFLVD
jgi:hypothetical protein